MVSPVITNRDHAKSILRIKTMEITNPERLIIASKKPNNAIPIGTVISLNRIRREKNRDCMDSFTLSCR